MWGKLAIVLGVAAPALFFRVTGIYVEPETTVLVYGAGVVASAVLLTWAAEAAQLDISSALALAILALIAVLPEYAVDLYFAYTAGGNPEFAQLAAANMTGSNRLLIGIGWPLVAFVAILAMRRARGGAARQGGGRRASPAPTTPVAAVLLPEHRRVELAFLAIASVYAFLIPFTRAIAWYDALVLLGLFGAYLYRVTRESRSEPDLVGVAAEIGRLQVPARRALVVAMFIAAAAIVVSAAEPFANGLVDTGARFGIDQYLLVQWLAPLSSEAPELIAATLLAWRLRAADGLGMLLSAKVNQWTLLVGSLWVAYTLGGGTTSLGLDERQTEEFLLTSAQAVLAFAVLADLRFGAREAGALLVLFLVPFPFTDPAARIWFSALYLAIAAVLLVRKRRNLGPIFRSIGSWGLRTAAPSIPPSEAH
jgi:cation:H+ antiporter